MLRSVCALPLKLLIMLRLELQLNGRVVAWYAPVLSYSQHHQNKTKQNYPHIGACVPAIWGLRQEDFFSIAIWCQPEQYRKISFCKVYLHYLPLPSPPLKKAKIITDSGKVRKWNLTNNISWNLYKHASEVYNILLNKHFILLQVSCCLLCKLVWQYRLIVTATQTSLEGTEH